ncbi:DUF6065 family protein [Mesorhizobium sp.]|uniref:DUF6065 family protein n=1 Tax=Mesorhizobium sp. TaxID=1871066 RepID=UPI0025BFCE36|nr:DUF6065 family protein [Mesorhizobium sp.]
MASATLHQAGASQAMANPVAIEGGQERNSFRQQQSLHLMNQLIAYVAEGHELRIRPAPPERDWMDNTGERFAYRCLPLNIANAHGWEILCATAFSAIWDGRGSVDAIRIKPKPGTVPPAVTHFGNGTLTFHVPCLFRTDPGTNLFVTGPLNRPKDGIAALSGIIETDWSPYTFTMNWKFTRPNQRVHFETGEPFCHLFPLARGGLDSVTPELRNLAENPELQGEFKHWSESRDNFNAALADPASRPAQDKWQKSYFRGVYPSGAPCPEGHQSRLRLRPFATK